MDGYDSTDEDDIMERHVVLTAERYTYLFGARRLRNNSRIVMTRRFISHYGVTPFHVVLIWRALIASGMENEHLLFRMEHLLWTLDLLKTDASEHVLQGRYHSDEKTIRKWTTIVIDALSELDVVSVLASSFDSLDCNTNQTSLV